METAVPQSRSDVALPVAARVAPRVALGVAVLAIGWLLLHAFEPLRLNWGDPWSDANVLTTLEYSAKYGLWHTSFTDVLDIGPLTAESYRYTHYPPLAEIFYGLVRKVVGKADIGVYRVFGIGFSAAMLYAMHAYAKRMFGPVAAAAAVVLFATSALFLQYADSMHQAPIAGFTAFAALACVARWADEGRPRDLALAGMFTFFCFLTAYDFYFFVPIGALGTAWLCGKRVVSRPMMVVAAAIAAGGALAIVTKSLFIIGAIGYEEFKADFVFQFFERATAKYSSEYRLGLAEVVAARFLLYMTPLFFVLLPAHLVLGWLGWRGRNEARRTSLAAPLLLLVAGAPFLIVFSQLTATQVLPMQCIVPYYAMGFGLVIARLVESPVRWRAAAAMVTAVFLVGWQVVHVGTFTKSFLRPADANKVAAFLDANDKNDFVFTNLLSDGPIQYYFQRHLQPMAENSQWAIGQYRTVLGRIDADRMYVVFFNDPNTRYLDKSLFPLLVRGGNWKVIGAPPLYPKTAMDSVVRYDHDVLSNLASVSTKVLEAGDITVYSVGWKEIEALMRGSSALAKPTEHIVFAEEVADSFKLSGIRGADPGKPYAWTVPGGHDRTVLTKTGVQWRVGGAPRLEAVLLLNLPPGSDYRVTVRGFSHLPNQTLGAMIGDRVLLAQQPLGEAMKSHEVTFTIPKDALGPDPIQTVRFPYGLASKNELAFKVDGEAPLVGIAFEELTIERLP